MHRRGAVFRLRKEKQVGVRLTEFAAPLATYSFPAPLRVGCVPGRGEAGTRLWRVCPAARDGPAPSPSRLSSPAARRRVFAEPRAESGKLLALLNRLWALV